MNISDYTDLGIAAVRMKETGDVLTVYGFKYWLRVNSVAETGDPIATIQAANADPVFGVLPPTVNAEQFAEWDGVEEVNGNWVRKWKVVADPARAELDKAHKLAELRRKRNEMLAASDWIHNGDSPVAQNSKDQWALYRQQLRDITKQPIDNIVWPTPPLVELKQ